MNMTMSVRRWAIAGAPVCFGWCGLAAIMLCGGLTPHAPWALLVGVPMALWWIMGAVLIKPVKPCWQGGSSRRLQLADRWLVGGCGATLIAALSMALLRAIYVPVAEVPGVLPALAAICVVIGQGIGVFAFRYSRLRLLQRWPGRFAVRAVWAVCGTPLEDPLSQLSVVRPPRKPSPDRHYDSMSQNCDRFSTNQTMLGERIDLL